MKFLRTILLKSTPPFVVFFALSLSVFGDSQPAGGKVLMISIDGLKPAYVFHADEHNLNIPNLRRLVNEGSSAAMKGVLPTSTYPSHTTLVTGVSPARHGIAHNKPFDPTGAAVNRWYWYAEDIQVPTLWAAAAACGRTVAALSWPGTVGADDIHYNIPEFAGTRTPEDLKMVRGFATPGLMREIEETAGEYAVDVTHPIKRDWTRTRYAVELIRRKAPDFFTVHLAATDTMQHRHGPYTPEALHAIEEVDAMVGQIVHAYREQASDGVVCIVSDHGFAMVERVMRLDAALAQAGLFEADLAIETFAPAAVTEWTAMRWPAGGSSAIFLNDPNDDDAQERVKALLGQLASNPDYGIAAVLDRKEIARIGGDPAADFWVDFVPGVIPSTHLRGALTAPTGPRGTHGHLPDHPEMDATFILSGKGIRQGIRLGRIDMRSVAPTIAAVLSVPFPSAELPPLAVFVDNAPVAAD